MKAASHFLTPKKWRRIRPLALNGGGWARTFPSRRGGAAPPGPPKERFFGQSKKRKWRAANGFYKPNAAGKTRRKRHPQQGLRARRPPFGRQHARHPRRNPAGKKYVRIAHCIWFSFFFFLLAEVATGEKGPWSPPLSPRPKGICWRRRLRH